jgi:hypothetical protein
VPIKIEPFVPDHIPEVRRFNERLQAGGAPEEYVFFETPQPGWLPKNELNSDQHIFNELFLAVDGSVVRGAYALKRQSFQVLGQVKTLGFYHHPFSEGIVSRAYSMVGAVLLNDVLRREPLTYCLGMGGYDRPLPRMLMAMKWKHFPVPFRFRILRPFRFLRGMETLRNSPGRSVAIDAAAFSGLGWAGIRIVQAWKSKATLFSNGGFAVTVEPCFGAWADEVWNECAGEYPLIAVRDQRSLNVLFPAANPMFERLRISRDDGTTAGWAVVSTRAMNDHPQYGRLRVGQIVDVLAKTADSVFVIAAAMQALKRQGADIAICNHSHEAWVTAMDHTGFLPGPSNFIFAAPPKLAALMAPFEDYQGRLFFTRADGDGLYRFV